MSVSKVDPPQGVTNFVYRPTRRKFLHTIASLPLAGTLLPFLLPGSVDASVRPGGLPEHGLRFTTRNGRDPGHKAVIIFMQGGLSFFDTFDPKTHADIRGPFNPINTACRDIQITNIIEPLARHMNKAVVINNLYGDRSELFHPTNGALVVNGSLRVTDRTDPYTEALSKNSFVEFSKLLTNEASEDVGYVVLHQNVPDIGAGLAFQQPYDAAKHRDPETLYAPYNTNSGEFTNPFRGAPVDIDRLRGRMRLLDLLDTQGHTLTGNSVERRNRAYRKAVSLTTGDFNRVFNINEEPEDVLRRYGNTPIGKQLLLARRMLQNRGRVIFANDGNYDHHYAIERNMRNMLPPFARALSALLNDIERIEEKTYVVLVTEFGRTPRLNTGNGLLGMPSFPPGRDHWVDAFGMVIFGNDIRQGRRIGQTDNNGRIVGDSYNASVAGETILELLKVGRFEKRGDVLTNRRFPFIDVRRDV